MTDIQKPTTGESKPHATISVTTAHARTPRAKATPAMPPTAVIDVDAGAPETFPTRRAVPMKNSTTMLTGSVKSPGSSTSPVPSVSTTRRPMVQAPAKKNTDISAAAVDLPTTSAPTAGANAGPVEEPPML